MNEKQKISDRLLEIEKEIEQVEKEYKSVDAFQYALKIFMNSFYGSFSNPYFRYYDIRLASAVTTMGQLSIKGPAKYVTDRFEDIDIVYTDTDSIFISLDKILRNRYGDKYAETSLADKRAFCKLLGEKKVNPEVERYYANMCECLNLPKNTYEMDFEAVADISLFTGKKKYIQHLVYDEYDVDLEKEIPMKVKGIEIVRTSTPQIVRDFLTKLVRMILETQDNKVCQQAIQEFETKFYKSGFEEVAFPRGVKGMDKYTEDSKGVPIHVRASKVYNRMLEELELIKEPKIGQGFKIRFAYIIEPSKVGSNVIACEIKMPEEIQKLFEIDYVKQFQVTTLNPIQKLFDPLDWQIEEQNSLDGCGWEAD